MVQTATVLKGSIKGEAVKVISITTNEVVVEDHEGKRLCFANDELKIHDHVEPEVMGMDL